MAHLDALTAEAASAERADAEEIAAIEARIASRRAAIVDGGDSSSPRCRRTTGGCSRTRTTCRSASRSRRWRGLTRPTRAAPDRPNLWRRVAPARRARADVGAAEAAVLEQMHRYSGGLKVWT
jgi:hypothetical protein